MKKLIAAIMCLSMLVSIPVFATCGDGGGSSGGASSDGAGSGSAGCSSGGASAGDSGGGGGSSGDGSGGVGLVNDYGDRKAKYMQDCDSLENFLKGKCR